MKAKPNNFPAEEEEKTFQYRSYGKGELASLYLPNITQQSAVERFNEWIDAAPGLKERLLATGSTRRTLVSKYSKNLRTAPSLEASKSCHRRCSGHVAPAGRQGREILRKGDTAR